MSLNVKWRNCLVEILRQVRLWSPLTLTNRTWSDSYPRNPGTIYSSVGGTMTNNSSESRDAMYSSAAQDYLAFLPLCRAHGCTISAKHNGMDSETSFMLVHIMPEGGTIEYPISNRKLADIHYDLWEELKAKIDVLHTPQQQPEGAFTYD